MHIPDLRTDTLQFPDAARVPMRPVGWLSDKHPFPTGKVDRSVVRRLRQFRAASHSGWQPYLSLGSHTCELCGDAKSHTHLFIPSDGLIYYAPEGIVHYIVDHRYAPPREFCEAVLTSPPPDSDEYFHMLAALGCGPAFLQNTRDSAKAEQPPAGLLSRLTRRRVSRRKARDVAWMIVIAVVLVRIVV